MVRLLLVIVHDAVEDVLERLKTCILASVGVSTVFRDADAYFSLTMPRFLKILFEGEEVAELSARVDFLRSRRFVDMVRFLFLPSMNAVTSVRLAFRHVVPLSNAIGRSAACSREGREAIGYRCLPRSREYFE